MQDEATPTEVGYRRSQFLPIMLVTSTKGRERMRRHKSKDQQGLLGLLTIAPSWVSWLIAVILLVGSVSHCGVFSLLLVCPFIITGILSSQRKIDRQNLLDRQESLDTIRAMTWQQFELLVGEAYRRQGYKVEERGGSGGDGGIDLILRQQGQKTLVQCKRWRTQQVGVSIVRELYGVMTSENAAGGILVTCGTFTPDARAFALGKPMALVNGDELLALVRRGQVPPKIEPEARGQLVIPPLLANCGQPLKCESVAVDDPTCPICFSPMRLRKARNGPCTGSQFWGCPAFPKCRGIRQI